MKIKNKKWIAILSTIVISTSLIGVGFASFAIKEKDYITSNDFAFEIGTSSTFSDYITFGNLEGFALNEDYGIFNNEMYQTYGTVTFEFAIKLNAEGGLNSVYSSLSSIDLSIDVTSTNSSINLVAYSDSTDRGTLYYGYSNYDETNSSISLTGAVSNTTLSLTTNVVIDSSYIKSDYIYCNLELNFDFSSANFSTDIYSPLTTDGGVSFTLEIGVYGVYEA